MTGLRFDRYDWTGGAEAILRFGPDDGPIAIVALPLFEEANRTRQFAVTICRALGEFGIGAVLPDFPGTGESIVETHGATVFAMREAYRALAQQLGLSRVVHGVGIRSGALLDTLGFVETRWHLAPQSGADVLRDLRRVRQMGSEQFGRRTTGGAEADYAGNILSDAMLADLSASVPILGDAGIRLRTVRLETDPRPASVKFPGTPLWRRAEPGSDTVLAQRLAADIAQWIAACAD